MSRKPYLFALVLLRFARRLAARPNLVVQVNTSLNRQALARDAFFVLLARCLGRRVVLFVHGWSPPFEAQLDRRTILRRVFRAADQIVVLATRFREKLLEWGIRVPVSVETTCFPPDLAKKRRAEPFDPGRGEGGPRVLFLSRVVREKGVFELLEACRQIRDEFPGLLLTVAGEGPALQEMRDRAASKEFDFLVAPGLVQGPAKASLLESSHALCLPSYGEGLPLSVLEALYFGLPVVTTSVGGLVDVLRDGQNGLFVEPRSVDDLARKLVWLFRNPSEARRMSRQNAQYAESRFSPQVVARRLAAIHEACHGI